MGNWDFERKYVKQTYLVIEDGKQVIDQNQTVADSAGREFIHGIATLKETPATRYRAINTLIYSAP